MANLNLAHEDDDSYSPLNFAPSQRKQIEGARLADTQRLHGCFDPKKVGFGILAPWPGTELAIGSKECTTAAPSLAGKDLEGSGRKEQE